MQKEHAVWLSSVAGLRGWAPWLGPVAGPRGCRGKAGPASRHLNGPTKKSHTAQERMTFDTHA